MRQLSCCVQTMQTVADDCANAIVSRTTGANCHGYRGLRNPADDADDADGCLPFLSGPAPGWALCKQTPAHICRQTNISRLPAPRRAQRGGFARRRTPDKPAPLALLAMLPYQGKYPAFGVRGKTWPSRYHGVQCAGFCAALLQSLRISKGFWGGASPVAPIDRFFLSSRNAPQSRAVLRFALRHRPLIPARCGLFPSSVVPGFALPDYRRVHP